MEEQNFPSTVVLKIPNTKLTLRFSLHRWRLYLQQQQEEGDSVFLTRLKLVHSHFPHTNTHAHNRASEIQILFKNSAILASTPNDLFWGHSCQCCCECVLLYFDELLNKTTTTASATTVVAAT